MHELVEQSPPTRHACPTLHFWAQPPPQSMSVSAWFCTVSVHDG
jgi:hypothetical protein